MKIVSTTQTSHHIAKKVFVGMSGGVDSSVSAALLKQQGYDVTGVFIKVWHPDWLPCEWKEERRDAMRAAAVLDIPFITIDLQDEYKKGVVDYMLAEYKAGRTPNPDVMCNKEVKFGHFLKKAREMGADYIATGHYAQVIEEQGIFKMLEGADKNKDQSYFLWTLGQEELKHTLFPVGHLQKSEVRALAQTFKLPTAQKKDSQGICFIGKVDMKEFLSHYIEAKPGNVLNEHGEVIGEHEGAIFYTIGQRHGFTISEKTPTDKPYYIVRKNIEHNTLSVSHKVSESDPIQAITHITLTDINPIIGNFTASALEARIRYRQQRQKVIVNGNTLQFEQPQDGVSIGQSVVLYAGEVCLGGGIIEDVR
jgi:tRNA-uridine 2-sulfurtransferase